MQNVSLHLGVGMLIWNPQSEDETPVDVERRVRHARFNTVPQLYVVYKETEVRVFHRAQSHLACMTVSAYS